MPLGQCVWCLRWRLVELQTWRSPRSGQQLCGEVCGHCYYGSGRPDDCRTCRLKEERAARLNQVGVRPLMRADMLCLIERRFRKQGRRAT